MLIYLGLVVGLTLVVGYLLARSIKIPGEKVQAVLYGLAAGLIFGLAIFELVPSAREFLTVGVITIFGLLGVGIMLLVDQFYHIPMHKHPEQEENLYKTGVMVAIGIAIHNLIEGFSFGVGFAAGLSEVIIIMTIGIAIHNLPLGLTLGVLLREASTAKAWTTVGLPVLAVFIGIIAGYETGMMAEHYIAYAFSFAAGSMTYIALTELLPQAICRCPPAGWLTFIGGTGVIILLP